MDDSSAPSKELRLAQYLKEFVGLRTTTVRDIAKYESALWLADMPQEKDCFSPAWVDGCELGEPWLEVKKQKFEKAPKPPELILPWVDAKSLLRATHSIPQLQKSIFVPDHEMDVEEGEEVPLKEVLLSERPEVESTYKQFKPRWEMWAQEYLKREKVQKVYSDLFSLYTQIRKQGEIQEVVLGLGLLEWNSPVENTTIKLRRHIVTAKVEIEFEPVNGVIRLVPPGESTKKTLEDDMLEAELRPDRAFYQMVNQQLEQVGDEIWDKALMHAALQQWAGALSADTLWSPSLSPQSPEASKPTVTFAPAIILRNRAQIGMLRIYEALIKQLEDPEHVIPAAWTGLVEDHEDDVLEQRTEDGEPEVKQEFDDRNSEIYFPLPANKEQKGIVQAIEHKRGVLVQGPPGTGKSHTIANLICHLLATGKRILITAETARALRVLKEKLPIEIQPLCVSLMGQGGDSFAELNTAVQGITTKEASFQRNVYLEKVKQCESNLDLHRRKRSEIDSELRSLREGETIQHQIPGNVYVGTASEIAKRVSDEKERYSWLKLPLESDIDPPTNTEQMCEWARIVKRYTEDQLNHLNLKIPSSSELVTPQEFANTVALEALAKDTITKLQQVRDHSAYKGILALHGDKRAALRGNLQEIELARISVSGFNQHWAIKAKEEVFSGRKGFWSQILESSKQSLNTIIDCAKIVGDKEVTIPESFNLRKIRADVEIAIDYFKEGGSWKKMGFITPSELKDRTYLKNEFLIDGTSTSSLIDLEILQNDVEIRLCFLDLESDWSNLKIEAPSKSRKLQSIEYQALVEKLEGIIGFQSLCENCEMYLHKQLPPIQVPQWNTGQVLFWIELIDAANKESEYRISQINVKKCASEIQKISQSHDVHPIVKNLESSVNNRNIALYSELYKKLESLEKMSRDQEIRKNVERRLSGTVLSLIDTVITTRNELDWGERFKYWNEAWKWAVADNWLEKRSNLNYQQKLWLSYHECEKLVQKSLAEIASLKAWLYFFKRLTVSESAALRGWRQAVKQMGKGTGKSSKLARLRREARQYMDDCRDAIPVWIMPRYLVAEMIDPSPARYDVLIVDEASQLGIESLFLFYLSKRMIVVGDDQQISPAGVGIEDRAIGGLQRQFLEGIKHKATLMAESSLYANALLRFNRNIVLREHFRCMPEIIQFSNDLCYASNGTPLDPLRNYSGNRLEPIVTRHVQDGYKSGASSQSIKNEPEAQAIVDQLINCIDDAKYKGKTFGVVSLQGSNQAKFIEQQLLKHLEPEVIDERKLLCGDAYAFQGDERDVIFLSMVAAPGETRIGALANDAARQRFNVAVSRAKDQVWLFHSVTLDALSEKCMRYRLLQYMLEPKRKTTKEEDQQFDSDFERQVYKRITEKGFHVRTQVCIGDPMNHRYRIDLVVEGIRGRLAVECDGEYWHGIDKYDEDMARQRDLERAGWQFVRVRGGDFYRDPMKSMIPVWEELERLEITPGDLNTQVSVPATLKDMRTVDCEPEIAIPDVDQPLPEENDSLVATLIASSAPKLKNSQNEISNAEPEIFDKNKVRERDLGTQTSDSTFEKERANQEQKILLQKLKLDRQTEIHTKQVDLAQKTSEFKKQNVLFGDQINLRLLQNDCQPYNEFLGKIDVDPRKPSVKIQDIANSLLGILEIESPIVAKRAYDIYLRSCGIQRMGKDLKSALNKSLQTLLTNGVIAKEDELNKGGLLYSTIRLKNMPHVVVRERGPRDLYEIPASEIVKVSNRILAGQEFELGSDEHLRMILDFYQLKRLTASANEFLMDVITKDYPYIH